MTPSDLTLLVVLGTADSGPATIEDIVGVARSLAPHHWNPTPEQVRRCTEDALSSGLLQDLAAGGPAGGVSPDDVLPGGALQTTLDGQAVIAELLRLPIGSSCGESIRACMSAKLCFLHHLPVCERGHHSHDLARLYHDELSRLAVAHDGQCDSAPCCRQHPDVMCLQSELAWLDAMRRSSPHNGPLGDSGAVETTIRC